MQMHWSCFGHETYAELLRTIYPEIGDIPHNTKMGEKNVLVPRHSRCTREWAVKVLQAVTRPDALSVVKRGKSTLRLIGALFGRRDLEVVALFLYRLLLLEERLRSGGVDFDWDMAQN